MRLTAWFSRCFFATSMPALALFVVAFPTYSRADIPGFIAPVLTSPINYQAGKPVVLGNVFTANTNFSVDALGFYYNPNLLTMTQSEEVGLFDNSGNLLASITVLLSDPVVGSYLFHSIAPVSIVAGNQYTVAAQVGDNPWAYGPPKGPPPTAPEITFNNDSFLYVPTLTFPTQTGGSGPAYYGPNFEIAPEPGFYGVLAFGLAGLGYAVFRRRSQRIV
jgi:uncharacterized protein DUF4082